MGDLERCVGRMMLNRALPHEYAALGLALQKVPVLRALAASKPEALLHALAQAMGDFKGLALLLEAAIHDDPLQAGIIKPGFDARLDEIRDLVAHAQQRVIALERAEQEATGINSLKIRYNQAHGYYIEITKIHMDNVPERYTRKQTLVGKERYVTPELLALEHDITHAQSSIDTLEKEVFERVKREVAVYGAALRKLAHALSTFDALVGFATVAGQRHYVRPLLTAGRDCMIKDGRHPVVECVSGHSFIPNDTQLDDTNSTYIITGPNMGGKSTYLRQVALINLMAQCGSFVPAAQASVPLVDRIFTRIGASDNVAAGKSTFLVEMEETATICSRATDKSLVILDEVGRGTSTFDGLAIAQAVVEHIHTQIKARCLFATHYHELTQLQEHLPGMVNYYAASKKTDQKLIFLYRMVPGIADGSFGIAVARLALLPKTLIARAEEILAVLKKIEELQGQAVLTTVQDRDPALPCDQQGLFQAHSETSRQSGESLGQKSPRVDQTMSTQESAIKTVTPAVQTQLEEYERLTGLLASIELDLLTPKAAFDLVWRLKNEISS
jgi:DNA mismatch repair protein MutS